MANCTEDLYGCDGLADLKARLGEVIAHENSHGDTFLTLQTIVEELSDLLCKVEHGEREWRDTFDAVQNPIFVHDQNHRIIRANQAYARKAGQNIQDVIGKPYWQVFPKGRGPLSQCTCQPRQNGIPQSVEVSLDNGETYLSRAFAARDAQGRYLYSVHILEDITEQRRLQAALTDSAERYRSLFEAAPDAIFLADTDTGQLLDANPAAERLIGRSREEILTLHQSQLHPADAPAVEDFKSHVRAALTNTPHPPSEIPVLCADGREIPTEISAKVFQLDGRRVIQGVFRDITARKRAEEKLTETGNKLSLSLHLLEGIVESVPIRVFWKDRDLRYLGCNTLFAKDAGLSGPDELIGKTDFDLGWKDQAALYREDDLRVMESGMPRLGYEEPQTTPDGKTLWLRTSKVPLRDGSREVIGILGIYDDITRQKQAEQDLLLSESRLKEAQGVAHLGSWDLDLVKNELWWSNENYRIFGTEPGALNTYETFLDTVHPDDRAFVSKAYSDSVENRTSYDIEHRLLMKDGSVKWVHERCKTYYDPQGKPLRSAGTTLDITKQHLTAQALSRSNRALRAISACNSVLIHATNEAELLNNMCRVIIDEGGYRFAWIGFADDGEEKIVRPVAHAGFEDGYLERINVTYADDEHGHGPAGCAVRHGELQVVHDTLNDPHFTPWREAAAKRGYRSVLSLPLKDEAHRAFAVLSIYAGEPDAFDAEAMTLMQELASDLAFGILALRTRDERDHYLREHLKSDERFKQALVDTIRAMALTVEKRDPYTAGHQNKVAQLSVAIGRELGMDEDRLEGLRLGAMIHDIGKIYVPAEILNRPGRLSKAEFEIIKSHPAVGYDIIKDVRFPWPVADMVLQHHERLDGSGYPEGLHGEEIIFEARILAVADVVEAITSHRPYRPAVGLDKALGEIETNRGTYYDPAVVDACLRLIRDKGFAFDENGHT